MRTPTFFVLTCALFASGLGATESTRFSQSLSAEQRATAGLDQLNSDQVAALDALVRLNLNQTAADALKSDRAAANAATASTTATPADAPAPPPAGFSQSLSVDQRRAAGLDALTAEQQTAVDTLVAAHSAPLPRYQPGVAKTIEAVEFFPNRFEVHGEVGLSLGGGSGGYSSRAGWLSTSLLDTKTGTEFGVTVITSHEKWKRPFRYTEDWTSVGFSIGGPVFVRP